MSLSFKRCVPAVLLCICAAYGQTSTTVSQGVYTDQQAKRGQVVYKDRCASCHGDTLGGRIGPPRAGDDFLSDWNKQPLSELFGKIKNTMPQDAPGKLTVQETADVLSYMLQAGKFPAGRAELRASEAALKQIAWPAGIASARTAQATPSAPSFAPAGNLAQ